MPRDGLNQYSPPPGTNGITNYTIESTKYNAFVADVTQDLNLPRPIVAGGTGASSADGALDNLSAEKFKQVVTNWDATAWRAGSFYAAGTATGTAPVAGHAFAGIVYYANATDLVCEATDLSDLSNPTRFIRIQAAGVWGNWMLASGGASTTGDYTFNNTTTFPPASGQIRFNNATENSTTEIFISHLNALGVDNTGTLSASLKSGYDIFVQDKDEPAKYKIFTANAAPVISGGDFRITVTLKTAGVDIVSGQRVVTSISTGSAVVYDIAQGLTIGQQSQARANINVTKKNYIINGAMMIGQENGSTAGSAVGYYAADQWSFAGSSAGTYGFAQIASATPGNSPNRIQFIAVTADTAVGASDNIYVVQRLEGSRVTDLGFGTAGAKAITIQFGVKAPAGTYCVTVLNSAQNRSYVAEYVIAAGEANVAVVKSVTIPGDTTATWLTDTNVGLEVRWGLMAGSTWQKAAGAWGGGSPTGSPNQFNFMGTNGNVFELFDVSLTEGTVAPPFQVPDYASELALCKRYFRFVGYGIRGEVETATGLMCSYVNETALRATPTVTGLQNTITIRRHFTATDLALAVTAHVDMACSISGGRYFFTIAGSFPVGERFHIQTDNILKLSARL